MSAMKQRGFSLIELMVAITLGLILMTGVLSLFFSSKVTYFANEKMARLQENGRVALDFVLHDVRAAGYNGCAKAVPFTSTLNTPTGLLWNYALPVQGYESDGAGGFSPALGVALTPAPVNDSDVIVTRSLARDGRALRVQVDVGSETGDLSVTNATPAPVAAGTIMIVTNCSASSVFQATGYTAGAPNGTIAHATGGALTPGNATNNLGWTYTAGARVAPLQTVIYYVGADPVSGEPGLYRKVGAAAPDLLIDGVQALQIAYGEDTNGDRIAESYVPANSVTNWDNIISVSLALLVRSEASGNNVDANSYQLLSTALGGKTLGPYNDRRQRVVFSTTVALRNRAW